MKENSINSVRVKKGYCLNISPKLSPQLERLKKPSHVAVLPDKIRFVKPRLLVAVGDRVNVGTPLFEDKRKWNYKFLSPGGGIISEIHMGPRRTVQEIIIELDPEESHETFEPISEKELAAIGRQNLIGLLIAGGVWPLIRELPFRDIADPEFIPQAIWVSLDALDPFQPAAEVYLYGKSELFRFGIRVLKKLAENVNIATRNDNSFILSKYGNLVTHQFSGKYPADDAGVLLYHTKKDSAENRCWYISGQDVLSFAALLTEGRYPTERIVAVSGDSPEKGKHNLTRLGVPVNHLAPTASTNGMRYIAGGLFRGYAVPQSSFLGFYETSLTLLHPERKHEFLGFLRPGLTKPSYSRTFLSGLRSAPLEMDNGMHGEERACINCGACSGVCPVNILPQFTYKCIEADETEEALAHGLLDCVECGLCSYVCPSKIELCDTFKNTRNQYYKERV